MRARPSSLRQAAQRRGRWAEMAAAWRLRVAGYRVLARNVRTPVGEIDLIVRRGHVLAFVEVKVRAGLDGAAEAIRIGQQTRIRNAAAAYLARHPELADLTLRFDAVLIAAGGWPQHVPDAWRDSGSWTR